MTENKITAICQECGKQFEYVLKPGFPRKYCFECSELKRATYEAKQPKDEDNIDHVPQKPGEVRKSVKGSAYEKDPVGLAVELWCAMRENNNETDDKDLMSKCIELVKQAKKAFE